MFSILTYIWRAWFYLMVFVAIVLLLPLLVISAQKASWYPHFFKLARLWAWFVLLSSGLWPKAHWHQRPRRGELYIICPNHTSMVDIMLTLALFPNCFLFIGKKELARLPIFGYFYRKTNILVDRANLRSRQNVFVRAAQKLDEGIGLCIYPEGGVPDEEVSLAPFKNGAFRLAVEKNLPIIPVSYPDNKRHLPFNIHRGGPGILRAEIFPFLYPQGSDTEEVQRLKKECYRILLESLQTEKKILYI